MNFTRMIFCLESHHQIAGKWPRLTGQILNIFDLPPLFFQHLTAYYLFQGFSDLNKVCNQAVSLGFVASIFCHQNFICTPGNEVNHIGIHPRILVITTGWIDHGILAGVLLGGSTLLF
jgi:hypothetical protein